MLRSLLPQKLRRDPTDREHRILECGCLVGTILCGFEYPSLCNNGRLANDFVKTTFDSLAQAHDQPGILKSREYFNSLIKEEVDAGIDSTRIVLGKGSVRTVFTASLNVTRRLLSGWCYLTILCHYVSCQIRRCSRTQLLPAASR